MSATKKLNNKHKKSSGSLKSKILIWGLKLALAGFLMLVILFSLVYIGTFGQLPDSAALMKIKEPVASEVYSKDNKLLGRFYTQNRSNIKFKEISPNLINALIATEDVRFYEHRGVDEMALLRVVFKTLFMIDRSSGEVQRFPSRSLRISLGGKIMVP